MRIRYFFRLNTGCFTPLIMLRDLSISRECCTLMMVNLIRVYNPCLNIYRENEFDRTKRLNC